MLEFNKTVFDNNFKVMTFSQDQKERYILRFLDKANWMPEEEKKIINEWMNVYKRNYENLKTYVDENYKKATDYFINLQTQGKSKKNNP
jgi:Na+/phosphate symporter